MLKPETIENLCTKIRQAAGEAQADLVLKGGKVFNVFTGQWEKADVALSGSTIVGLGTYEGKKQLSVEGKYLTPGFLDAHMHIESSMLAPRELAKVLLLNGVTGIFADPHEIANVLGVQGVKFMLTETQDIPLNVYIMAPSCVPATQMETSGAVLTARDLAGLLQEERVLGLGEMMNYPGVLGGASEVLAKLQLPADALTDGHAPGLTGQALNAYITAGVNSDHEAYLPAEAAEKIARGMYLMLREGSAAHNLVDLLPVVNDFTFHRCCLATDDRHLDDLVQEGSINYLIRLGMERGCKLEQLLTMGTLNTAQRFRLSRLGALAPGYQADINVFADLQDFKPDMVLHKGRIVVENRQLVWSAEPVCQKPPVSVHMPLLTTAALQVAAVPGKRLRVMTVQKDQLVTGSTFSEPLVVNNKVVSDTRRDILKIAVCERHHQTGNIGLGFVQGLALRQGALASTVAHDSHNLIVAGTTDADMVVAANALRQAGGGLVVVSQQEVKCLLPLPIAGLMSDEPGDKVLTRLTELKNWSHKLGVPEDLNSFMLLSFLALPVIPSLKLSDKGLIDVDKFTPCPLWE